MLFFIDSADEQAITACAETGLVDGVTTNPSLIAQSGADVFEVLKAIAARVSGPISAESVAADAAGMVREGKVLAALADNIVVKLPLNVEGLKACRELSEEGIQTNVTLCFSSVQALLAAKAGATYVSPFLGRQYLGGKTVGVVNLADILNQRHAVFANIIQAASQPMLLSRP